LRGSRETTGALRELVPRSPRRRSSRSPPTPTHHADTLGPTSTRIVHGRASHTLSPPRARGALLALVSHLPGSYLHHARAVRHQPRVSVGSSHGCQTATKQQEPPRPSARWLGLFFRRICGGLFPF